MGNKILGADIAGTIAKEMGGLLLPAALIKHDSGARVPGSLTSGPTIVETTYSCRGFIDMYSDSEVDGTVVQQGDRKVSLLGDTISAGQVVPETGDQITIEGETFEIIGPIGRDPDAALYECQCRK